MATGDCITPSCDFLPSIGILILMFGSKNILLGTNNDFVVQGFKLHKLGLTPLGEPSYADWKQCGAFLREAEKSVQFWIGDWLNYGEKQWGKRYEEGMQQTG